MTSDETITGKWKKVVTYAKKTILCIYLFCQYIFDERVKNNLI